MCNNPSFPATPKSTNAPKFIILVTVPSYISPTSISLAMSIIIFIAFFPLSVSVEYMQTFPSSDMSIFTPVASIILLIIFPPGPITSFILSVLIVAVKILGAYLDISSLGFSITGAIISSNI